MFYIIKFAGRSCAMAALAIMTLNTFALRAESENQPVDERGFSKGSLLWGFTGGALLDLSGSYISHEVSYDNSLREKSLAQSIQGTHDFDTITRGPTYELKFITRPTAHMNFEYGLTDHIGVGLDIVHMDIAAVRQDIVPSYTLIGGQLTRQDYLDPFPMQDTLYKGTGMLTQASYHPLSNSLFDPYAMVRAGVIGFTGTAHRNVYYNPNRLTNQVHNGVGFAYDLAAGVNLHLTSFFGLRIEMNYMQQYLKSDTFDRRTLGSYELEGGLFFNFK